MARTISVEIVGNAESVEKAFAKASASAQGFNRSLASSSTAYGAATAGSARLSAGARTAERDLGKATRGALAGSGVFRSLGRSLAFASGGFLAISGAASVIRGSIQGAESLEKAQASLDVAIRHTGGDLKQLLPQYKATARAAQQFGINQADATTGLARATVLTGSAVKAQRAYEEALLISKATGKDFNFVLTATAKGQEGVTTSLQRYGIEIKKGTPSLKQYQDVLSRFGGQAKANTTVSERFNATLQNSEEIIGAALLPVLNKYAAELGAWLDKMNRSGQLQKDVNKFVRDAAQLFHVLGGVVKTVDKVTGGFAHTLEILAAFKFASVISGWISSLDTLIAKWGAVKGAALGAEGAEAAATATGAGAAAAAGSSVATRVAEYTGAGAAAVAAKGAGGASLLTKLGGLSTLLVGGFAAGGAGLETQTGTKVGPDGFVYMQFNHRWYRGNFVGFPGSSTITVPGFRHPQHGLLFSDAPVIPIPKGFGPPQRQRPEQQQAGPFGNAQAEKIFTQKFSLTALETLRQAQAALTRTTVDDVKAAREVVARIKKLIDEGRLKGAALIQALGLEASALSTIWSAEDAAAQKRAAAAAKAKARIQAQLANMIDPLRLEVALSKAEATNAPTIGILRQLRASAEKALKSGRLSLAQQKQAWDQIAQLNQQITQAMGTAGKDFTVPLKLQLAEAKAQALGTSDTKILLKMKAAAEKALKSGKLSIQGQINAWNEIQQINQQLGSSAQSALGQFKQLNTRQLVKGLGLTKAQLKALRARLSQVGPGMTIHGSGVGAYGFVIGHDNRPIVIHNHTHLDGRELERSTTRRQQRRRRRSSSQRRGPNAVAG